MKLLQSQSQRLCLLIVGLRKEGMPNERQCLLLWDTIVCRHGHLIHLSPSGTSPLQGEILPTRGLVRLCEWRFPESAPIVICGTVRWISVCAYAYEGLPRLVSLSAWLVNYGTQGEMSDFWSLEKLGGEIRAGVHKGGVIQYVYMWSLLH